MGRECLSKRATAPTGVKGEALLVDDGFAVGLGFVLHVFGVQRSFQALHWPLGSSENRGNPWKSIVFRPFSHVFRPVFRCFEGESPGLLEV